MITRLIFLSTLLSLHVHGSQGPDLRRVHSSEDLARFIFKITTNATVLKDLLSGLDRTGEIKLPSYDTAIPIREIYATIVEARFGGSLGDSFYERGKTYAVREICSFRDSRNEVWRYHIGIFEERQYQLMREFLKKKLAKRAKRPTTRLQATPDGAVCQYRASLARRA